MNFGKKVGQLKQWTAEKAGKAEKTDVGDDFKQMDQITEHKRDQLERLATETKYYLQTSGKLKLIATQVGVGTKPHSMVTMGSQMVACGSTFSDESEYGNALIKAGEAFEKAGSIQHESEGRMNEVFLQPLLQTLDGDLKEWQHQKKKLESRRLDFDAKNAKLKGTKGPTEVAEAEMNAARNKFEETLQSCRDLMIKINSENEEDEMRSLEQLVEAQKEYFERGLEIFTQLSTTLRDPSVVSNRARKPSFPSQDENGTDLQRKESKIEKKQSSLIDMDDAPPAITPSPAAAASSNPTPTPKPKPAVAIPVATPVSAPVAAPVATAKPVAAPKPEPTAAPKPVPTARPKSNYEKKEKRVGTFVFVAENPDELSFQKGDVLTVLEKNDDGWWRGELNGKTGMFPSNYTAPTE